MSYEHDGWLTRVLVDRLRRLAEDQAVSDPEWAAAIAAESVSVPPGRSRLWWVLGGLWFLLVQRPAVWRRGANWVLRPLALFGMAWTGLWLYASISVLLDDAPDVPWPYSGWLASAEAVVVLAFIVALWRPVLAALLAVPAVVGYAIALWLVAVVNDGSPVLAVVLFVGPPVVLFALMAIVKILPTRDAVER